MRDENNDSKKTKKSDEIFCWSCGESIKRKAEFCPHCGVQSISAKSNTVPSKNKRYRRILVLGFGLFLILVGVASLTESIIGGILIITAGVLILPPFGESLKKRKNVSLPGWLKVVGAVVLVIIGVNMVPTGTTTSTPSAPTKAPQETVSEQKEELEEPSEPAKFKISRMSVTPSEINPGETVHISVSIKNIGGKEGSKEVKLAVNGSIIKTKSVTLDPGKQKDIIFNIVGEEIGKYYINVLGMEDAFEVKRPFLDVSFSKFNSLFGAEGTLTSAQKEKKFNSEYKDKYVKWTCNLVDVSETLEGLYSMQLRCSPQTISTDMTVELKKDQKDEAINLTKGQQVTFLARLTGYSELVGHSADKGILVNIKNQSSQIEQNLSVGETAKTSKKEVTVVSVKRDKTYLYSSMGESFVQNSNRGKEFILAEVIIKNTGEDTIYVGSTDFSLMDSEGYKYDTKVYYGNDGINFVELYPNQKVKGKILFEIPDSAVGLKIMYNFGGIISGPELASWSVEE